MQAGGSTESTYAGLSVQTSEDPNEVSYAVIHVNRQDINQVLQHIATAINVRLSLEGEYEFPMVYPDRFDSIARADKLFLYGPSGSGKSRTIFEIIKNSASRIGSIYIINPRNVAGLESGRIRVRELLEKLCDTDAVIWDNFPDDLINREIDNAKRVLQIIGSRDVSKLLIALKPKYLETFRDLLEATPELYSYQMTYDRDSFKKIIQIYGTEISQFRDLYSNFVARDVDQIAKILWQKEPTLLVVLDYYNELKTKSDGKSIDAIQEAQDLPRSTNYYEHQFELLSSFPDRKKDVEFLYILRLCYELGLRRDAEFLEKLQKEIFASVLDERSYRRLQTWVYLSGLQYAMHDVCREAVRFTDSIRARILQYLIANLQDIVGEDSSLQFSVGTFVGRNIQYISRDETHAFLPENLSRYMKGRVAFERAVGLGIGDVFQTLDRDLQSAILDESDRQLEFTRGLAEGVGHVFPSLDESYREQILQKIYNGILFARYFGQSMGRQIKTLPPAIMSQLQEHAAVNPQFADGLGMGFGYVFGALDEETKARVQNTAEKNVDMTRGLGCGIALNLPFSTEQSRKAIYQRAESDSDFDKGLGMGLGLIYTKLPEAIKKEVIDRGSGNQEFFFGFGIYAGYSNLDRTPQELLDLSAGSVGLANGLGIGFGVGFPYIQKEFRSYIDSKCLENTNLDEGLGTGLGFVFRQLPGEMQARFLASVRSEFDSGLGFGIGFAWWYQSEETRQKALEKINCNETFGRGLAFGFGYHFSYLPEKLRHDVIARADGNPEFDRGLGIGLAYAYPYLDASHRDYVFARADAKSAFASGAGTSLGRIFYYLPADIRSAIISKAGSNPHFARGFGFGIGRYLLTLGPHPDLDSIVETNKEVASGAGEGIGYSFNYLPRESQRKFLEMAAKGDYIARGLGIGLGRIYSYLSPEIKKQAYAISESNIDFAIGLGAGIGRTFKYIGLELQGEIISKAAQDTGFAQGLGRGLGSVLPYLERGIRESAILQLSFQNAQFVRGLGAGIGSIFTYLDPGESAIVSARMDDSNFAAGLGEGVGFDLDSQWQQNAELRQSESFAIGLMSGFAQKYSYLEKSRQEELLAKASDQHANTGLGLGLGNNFYTLSCDLQSRLLDMAGSSHSFGKSLYFAMGHTSNRLSDESRRDIYLRLSSNSDLSYWFGEGMGRNFLFLDEASQEEALTKAEQLPLFGKGLGRGLSLVFRYIDTVSQKQILKIGARNSEFAKSLGSGLGQAFPALPSDLQQELLKVLREDYGLSMGLAEGIGKSLSYLGEEIRNSIISTREAPKSSGAESTQYENHFIEFPMLGIAAVASESWVPSSEEISFFGQGRNFCVCYIDIVGSTKIASVLSGTRLANYYGIFLNAMATIAKNFGAKVLKNAGDALIYYFPDTEKTGDSAFRDVLECGMVMIAAHAAINAKLHDAGLPSVSYRISADYGRVEIARSESSQQEDLFGSAMNIAAKINSRALPNGMAIGEEMYQRVRSFNEYVYEEAGGSAEPYLAYHVRSKERRNIVNPFKRTASQ